jgi:hypothetical protein
MIQAAIRKVWLGIVQHGIRAAVFLLLAKLAMFCAQACGAATPRAAVVTVADVVNEVAQRGDVLYGVGVETCDAAERVAVEQGTPEQAEQTIRAIRAQCDEAFRAFDRLRIATERLDEAVAAMAERPLSAKELSDLALDTRRLHAEAAAASSKVHAYLSGVGK